MGRILLSICALVVALGLSGTQQQPQRPTEAGGGHLGQAAARPQTPADAAAAREGEGTIEKATGAPSGPTEQEQARDDLKAQKDMAFWAAVGAVATAGASILAFLAWTNSAKALRVATQGQRAHLLLEDTLGGNCFGYPPRQRQPVFCYKIANHGQSPAWITGLEFRIIVGDLPDQPPVITFANRRTIVMAPNKTSDYFTDDMDLPEGFKWSDDLYVAVALRYRDIYDERLATCLFKLLLHGGPKNQDIMVPWGGQAWWKYT